MENSASPFARKKNQQLTGRKFNTPQKDLWSVVREGSLNEVDSALALLKKNGGNIDARNVFGLTPLHIATWRNHVPIVRRLLAAGADPDARDGESGWSSLHRALHFGHLAVASILLHSGASLTLEDSKSRTPADLLSGPVLQVVGEEHDSVARDVFSWGSGANYQLGTGNAHIQKLPCRLDVLQGSHIKMLSASKFHSVAVGTRGEVYTWGFGRGGRLGHPDFDIHSGQAAVITPRQVTGLGSRQVKAIAAAKHHTVATTEGGEVFTWGSNREGQLGYTSVDTQPTPRRVSSLKSRIVAVAAANKHTAVVSESGEVFTWGCNKEGQLGYGTSNSASNYTPRVVECLKGKVLTGVAAAKYHTVVLGADGEVFTWGHRLVTPRRIVISRNIKKSEGTQLKFHRMERLHVVAIAAGMVHSLALTDDGSLFYWVSSDPDLRCRQLYSMCGRNLVSVSAGKYWTAAVSTTGDIYMWDGKKCKGEPPVPTRLHGVKHATSVSVGETHLLMVCALYHPIYPPKLAEKPPKSRLEKEDELDELDEDFMFDKVEDTNVNNETDANKSIPSLKSLCEKAAAEHLVEPKNAIQLLEVADSLEADDLRKHCEDICIRNLDYIVIVSAQAIASASPEILANLEKLWDAKSSEPWSYRRLPTSTATFPAVINSEEDDSDSSEHFRVHSHIKPASKIFGGKRSGSFLHPSDGADESIARQIRAIRKKLQQIEMLEVKQSEGHLLDDQQLAKLKTKSAFESSLAELGIPVHKEDKLPVSLEGKGNKIEAPKKQKKKSKKNAAQGAVSPAISNAECFPVKGFLASDNSQVSKEKEQEIEFEEIGGKQISDGVPFHHPNKGLPQICKKDVPKIGNIKTASPAASKKKKKGGLSMFLSGALDDVPKDVAPPPPTPKIEGPAWGGAKISEKSTSLLVIQDEQSKTREKQPSGKLRTQVDDEGKNAGHLRLSSFMPVGGASNPIAVVSARTSLASEGEKGTLPWVAAGTSPVFSRPSLRDIQMQEEKKHQSFSHSPKTETAGFSVMTGQGSPSDSNVSSKWFKPDIQSPSSIRSIQIEEKAMKDLKRFYSSVKLVRNQT